MSLQAAPAPDRPESLPAKLTMLVRPEFTGPLIRVAPDDPVFARGCCQVPDCPNPAWTRLLCNGHYMRWRHAGEPEMDLFTASTGQIARSARSVRIGVFDLTALTTQARLEIGYVLQCRHDERGLRLLPVVVRHLIGLLAATDVSSLLDRPLPQWLAAVDAKHLVDPSRLIGLLRYADRLLRDLDEGADAESEFGKDLWRLAVLGIAAGLGPTQLRFDGIGQPWLRAGAKRYARFRLGAGKSAGTVDIDVRAVRWLSRFLTHRQVTATNEAALTREVFEHYLPWLAATDMHAHTRNTLLVSLRGFLDSARRYGWLPNLPAGAAIYLDELPRRPQPLPRFIPEFVMSQLENPANLALLPDDTTRHLIVILMETGLRANDACALPFNPIIDDSVGWPCLRYYNHKMSVEQLVPLSAKAAAAIRAQQQQLTNRWPGQAPATLFPTPFRNPDGHRSFSYATLRQRLVTWQENIGLRDETGQPARITAHQFRHTLGTRMINAGVPQHVVQKLLGHASPQMTARYAILHDTTMRQVFDDYQQQRININGELLGFDPDATAADAEWIKHNLGRVHDTLPNGYCGRPPQQDCPHPNACLTCPDFQTTPQFLSVHRAQRETTAILITTAEELGRTRLAANHRTVAEHLDRIIPALEALEDRAKEPTNAS